MKQNIGKYIYKGLVSVFMAYLIIRFFYISLDYALNWVDRFYAFVTIELKFTEPVSVDQLNKLVSAELTSIEVNQVTKHFIIKRQSKNYDDLPKIVTDVIDKLNSHYQPGSFEIIQSEFNPQPVSMHDFRLQMTVFIPAFIMAIFWFFHLYHFIQEEKRGKK